MVASEIVIGDAVAGAIDYENDVDFFRFTAAAGQLYQIDLALGTLDNSFVAVHDPDKLELAYNDDHGDSLASRIVWEAPESGDYYVEVGASWVAGSGIGSYTLTISLSDIQDDHGNGAESATAIAVGTDIQASIDYENDPDFFRFTAQAGRHYRLNVTPGTLSGSTLTLFDPDGFILASHGPHGGSHGLRVLWEALKSGGYYVEVGAVGGTGSYTLTITFLAQPESDSDASAHELMQLTENSYEDVSPLWSPDGSMIAFASDRDGDLEIYVMNADGSGVARLTENSERDFPTAWSPDGSMIAFASDQDGDWEIYVMNADGTGVAQLTDNSDVDWPGGWSPDGGMIAFTSDRDGDLEVYVMNADGSGVTQLTDNSDEDGFPAWSPDGSKIAFNSGQGWKYAIFVMNANGSDVTRLTNNADSDALPAWSPDGSKIAFISGQGWNYAIFAMNADGSNLVQLTNTLHEDTQPAWSPDGSKIAFTSDRGGDFEIYVMSFDG